MATKRVTVRGVNADLWKLIQIQAIERDMPVSELLNEILRLWLIRDAGNSV